MEVTKLARAFLTAAQRLTDRMLSDLGARDAEMGAAVAQAVQSGERLSLSFVFDRDEPAIVLESLSDYGSRRQVATIPLKHVAGGKH